MPEVSSALKTHMLIFYYDLYMPYTRILLFYFLPRAASAIHPVCSFIMTMRTPALVCPSCISCHFPPANTHTMYLSSHRAAAQMSGGEWQLVKSAGTTHFLCPNLGPPLAGPRPTNGCGKLLHLHIHSYPFHFTPLSLLVKDGHPPLSRVSLVKIVVPPPPQLPSTPQRPYRTDAFSFCRKGRW